MRQTRHASRPEFAALHDTIQMLDDTRVMIERLGAIDMPMYVPVDGKLLEVTEWHDAAQLPARSGVYEVESKTPGVQRFRYFDGGNTWYYGDETPRGALRAFQVSGILVAAVPWRGLTERAE